jgi:hypothetical protein
VGFALRQADGVVVAEPTIVPELRRAGTLQFEQLDRMREIGREAGREALDSGVLTALNGPPG